ncbi:hypothetical protein AB4Y96_24315 [Phyllobacterium sp. TAF24]|uniref:hypothetical protein n=1 Tax=Phyllobacterium sp. TAF24 TaxID=3233068 RepID=UPI003F946665
MRELTLDEMKFVAGGMGPGKDSKSKDSSKGDKGGKSTSAASKRDTESNVNRADKRDRVQREMSTWDKITHALSHTDISGHASADGASIDITPHCGSCHGANPRGGGSDR